MDTVRKFSPRSVVFSNYGEGPGEASIARLVTSAESTTMGAYLARFDGRAVKWTVRYDELIAGIQGTFRLRTSSGTMTLELGEVLWIPENTEVEYSGDDALVFIAIAPVDWRSRLEKYDPKNGGKS